MPKTLLAVPIDFDKHVDKSNIVTDDKILDSQGKFSQQGIFSSRIFGNMNANSEDYTCDCGKLQGHFNEGVLCDVCNSNVIYRGCVIEREGWISLNHVQIHPIFYNLIATIIGRTTLEKIIKYKAEVQGSGISTPPKVEAPYHNIGLALFEKNFDDILTFYLNKKSKKNDVTQTYNLILEHRSKVFCHYFPIMNSKLRPAILIGGEFSFDEINIAYNMLVKNSNVINSLTSLERIDLNIENIAFKSQMMINEIYQTIVKNLSSKDGPIRGGLLGNRFNFSSRMVITPGGSDMDIDEVDIPYVTAVEFFKPMLIRKISELKRISLVDAKNYIEKRHSTFNELIYSLMLKILESDNFRILTNRNPTIAIGSIMLLRIRNIKRDIDDYTASIHNLILNSLSGDYDGDVLTFILIVSKHYINFFEEFSPYNLLLDSDSGKFSKDFLPSKDTFLGLSTLFKE